MGQTARGFTFVDPVDGVGTLPTVMEELAEEVNDHVGRHAAGIENGIATGSAGSYTRSVVFPVGRFTAAGPSAITCTVSSGNPTAATTNWTIAWATGISASGFTINVRCNWNPGNVSVHYHAVEV